MMSVILSVLVSCLLDPHCWVGIALGIIFSPLWVKLYNLATAALVKADPAAATVIADVKTVTADVVAVVTPAVDAVIPVAPVAPAAPASGGTPAA